VRRLLALRLRVADRGDDNNRNDREGHVPVLDREAKEQHHG
jgi:hypothetical protein